MIYRCVGGGDKSDVGGDGKDVLEWGQWWRERWKCTDECDDADTMTFILVWCSFCFCHMTDLPTLYSYWFFFLSIFLLTRFYTTQIKQALHNNN